MNIKQLIVYNKIANNNILKNIEYILESDINNIEELKSMLYETINKILEVSNEYGFSGNLWKTYFAYMLVDDENVYSKSCEIVGSVEGSINQAAEHDFKILKKYYNYDLTALGKQLGIETISILYYYKPLEQSKKIFNKYIQNSIYSLSKELDKAKDDIAFKNALTDFYKEYGVGKIGLHKAFRIDDNNEHSEIVPITNIANVEFDDLVGYDIPKKQLIDNTKAFIEGKKANNCLLYGDAGTGKSTCIKAIANKYYGDGLRIIEVYKHQFKYLNDIISQIKNRNYKFIIYLDDLSFEEFEIEYKYLKAIIEGSLEKKPDNILIYATSNRRHLIKETFADRYGIENREDINTTETMQEKLSLAARFGESIFFCEPTRAEFLEIVKVLAKRNKIEIPEDEFLLKANQWELRHADQSGRTAQQFIDHLIATQTYWYADYSRLI